MAEADDPTRVPGGSERWPLVALGLVAAAWAVCLLTAQYAGHLQEQWGPAPDVVDALGRDAYVARRTLPFFTVAVVLDGVAAGCLLARSRWGWPLAVKVLAAVLLVPTCGFHALGWLITGLFAS